MIFALVNRSTLVSNADAIEMARTVDMQLRKDVARLWGRTAPRVMFYPDASKVPPGNGVALFDLQDTDKDVPDALGYHDEANGRYYAPILDAGGTALSTPTSVSSVLSHEAIELFGDAPVNIWADCPDSKYSTAYELCDAVQGDSYFLNKVSVSNFLLPAWFDRQNTVGPFDFMKELHAPFTMSKDGYMIVRTNGRETQIMGILPPHKSGRVSARQLARGIRR
jgi:hypothetical protein